MNAFMMRQRAPCLIARRSLLLAAIASCAGVRAADNVPAAQSVRLEVHRIGARFRIAASALIACPVEALWATLVDYERLPQFVPDMELSKVVDRVGNALTVRQAGKAGWGPFKQRFELMLAVQEVPLERLSATALSGDVSFFESAYTLKPAGSEKVQIEYAAVVEPKAFVPPFLGTALMRASMLKQFEALLAEAQRRAASAGAPR
jgi:ribosome-associated toxin RatA of RatAB toxin-antitoxin module